MHFGVFELGIKLRLLNTLDLRRYQYAVFSLLTYSIISRRFQVIIKEPMLRVDEYLLIGLTLIFDRSYY